MKKKTREEKKRKEAKRRRKSDEESDDSDPTMNPSSKPGTVDNPLVIVRPIYADIPILL